ncbi:hypothetical protein ACYFX5_01650 [Bremerella sp. T1]|uniref:hypothetical protein n=1 Tax=Bremerella sp. TYQ1 TaxID=3119568 RepID=UPI001CCF87FD|nr:hypothetical protein [Bremerella volcania]UBM36987.1 hypothetical protein LA756_03600 [Bremerella volcania]
MRLARTSLPYFAIKGKTMTQVSHEPKISPEWIKSPERPVGVSNNLIGRLQMEVDGANARVESIRASARKAFDVQQAKCKDLRDVAGRLQHLLRQQLDAFVSVEAFQDFHINEKWGGQQETRPCEFRRTVTLTVPNSERFHANVVLEFNIDADQDFDNLILDFKLEVIPVYVKFKAHDRLTISAEGCSQQLIAEWIDNKLVEFAQIYFEIYFSEYYQIDSLVHDPVMNKEFPKAFAYGTKQFNGKTYYSLTAESYQAFAAQPGLYVR